jgi:hypothetical protein
MSVPTISPGEMQLLLSRAGLVLNPGQVADLVLAWRQVAGLIASIPHDRPLADDLAYVFRLPPPAGAGLPTPATALRKSPATVKKRASPKAKSRAKPKVKAKAASKPKRVAAKPAPRKGTRRSR